MQVHLGSSPKVFVDFPSHQHNVWEILLCLQGTGTANIAGQEYLFREGTIFCIPPMTPHSKHSKDGYTDLSLFTADFTPPDLNRTLVFQDDADGSFRFLVSSGKILDKPKQFIGTSLVVELDASAQDFVCQSVQDGWEPHYVVTYGDCAEEIQMLGRMLGIPVYEY